MPSDATTTATAAAIERILVICISLLVANAKEQEGRRVEDLREERLAIRTRPSWARAASPRGGASGGEASARGAPGSRARAHRARAARAIPATSRGRSAAGGGPGGA